MKEVEKIDLFGQCLLGFFGHLQHWMFLWKANNPVNRARFSIDSKINVLQKARKLDGNANRGGLVAQIIMYKLVWWPRL